MPANYKAKDATQCWETGDYDAELIKVEDKESKSSGNAMQVLTWKIYHPDGRTQTISDYIVFPAATFKLKQLAVALGLKAEFEAETFQADDHIGATVIAALVVEVSDEYDDKNKIGKLKPAASAPKAAPKPPTAQPASASGKVLAYRSFNTVHAGEPDIDAKWKVAVKAYFGDRKPDDIQTAMWHKFISDDFKKPSVANPIEDSSGLADADIPF